MPKKDAITFIHPIQATGNVSNQMIPEPGIAPEKLMLSQSHLFWIHIFEMHLYKAKKGQSLVRTVTVLKMPKKE